MQVSVESNGVLERRMTVQVPSEQIDQEVEKRLRDYAKNVRIDGFRRGKVPVKIVRKRFGAEVHQEAVGKVIETTFYEALKEQELAPMGAPEITPHEKEEGEEGGEHFSYTATFEVMPEVKLADRADLAFEQISAEVAEANVDAMLEDMRKQRRTWKEVDRAAAEGDRVTVDYEARDEAGELVEKVGIEGFEAVLGEGDMDDEEVEQGLDGVRAGERREIDIAYPEEYRDKDLRGKTLRFEVTCRKVEEVVLPEMDEAFIQSFDVEEGGIAALREQVESKLRRELDDRVRSTNKTAVMDVLVESHAMPVPKALVEEEIRSLQEEQRRMFQFALPAKFLKDRAERRVLLSLIIREIIQSNDIQADPQRAEAWIARLAEDYEEPQEFIDTYRGNAELMERAEAVTLEEQVVEWICEGAQVTQVNKTFDEVMNRKPEEPEPESKPESDGDEGETA